LPVIIANHVCHPSAIVRRFPETYQMSHQSCMKPTFEISPERKTKTGEDGTKTLPWI
jgi:hypothetical protein